MPHKTNKGQRGTHSGFCCSLPHRGAPYWVYIHGPLSSKRTWTAFRWKNSKGKWAHSWLNGSEKWRPIGLQPVTSGKPRLGTMTWPGSGQGFQGSEGRSIIDSAVLGTHLQSHHGCNQKGCSSLDTHPQLQGVKKVQSVKREHTLSQQLKNATHYLAVV